MHFVQLLKVTPFYWVSQQNGASEVYKINKNIRDTIYNKSNYDDVKWLVTPNWQAKGYRLPTEAEWEFAASGGNKPKGFEYSGSDDIEKVAWYSRNSDSKTHPVRRLKANELGLFDMSGNVWEWCYDWYAEYNILSNNNPTGAQEGSNCVVRGGSWYYKGKYCWVANRYDFNPDIRSYDVGFRCVRYD